MKPLEFAETAVQTLRETAADLVVMTLRCAALVVALVLLGIAAAALAVVGAAGVAGVLWPVRIAAHLAPAAHGSALTR